MNEQKKLGLGSGIAICMGLIVATSCLVSLGQGFGLAGSDFIYALIIVVLLNSFVALSFSVIILIGSMFVFGVMGVFHLTTASTVPPEMIDPLITSAIGIVGLSALAFWLFIGVEFVIPVSKEMKNPGRNIPLSMIITLFVLLIIQSILGNGMLNYAGTEELPSADMPHIVYAERLFGRGGYIWMSIVTLFAAVSTLNTVLPTVGRIHQGMADEGMMPKFLRTVNRYNSPWVGMIIIVIAVLTMIMTGYVNTNGLIDMLLAGSCFWIASYIFTHLNVLVLRRRYPNAMRNNKLKLLGIPQVIGMIGCVYMIWNISDDMDARVMIYKIFGLLFAALAIFAWMWVRGKMKVYPFKPVYIGRMNIDRSINFDAKSSL
jgi:amino acid transporter